MSGPDDGREMTANHADAFPAWQSAEADCGESVRGRVGQGGRGYFRDAQLAGRISERQALNRNKHAEATLAPASV
jgi:hypothetical protein